MKLTLIKNGPQNKHADGSVCLRDWRRVEESFKPCCSRLDHATEVCNVDYVRVEQFKGRMHIKTAAGPYMEISFCPWCGNKF